MWTWDTTKLPGPVKGTYYTLYVILDIFSRYVVGWQIARSESAKIAQRLIAACCEQQRVVRGQLTVHADRGSPMIAKSTAQPYVDLGIAQSLSVPPRSSRMRFVQRLRLGAPLEHSGSRIDAAPTRPSNHDGKRRPLTPDDHPPRTTGSDPRSPGATA